MTARDKWSRQKGANRATLDSHTRAVKVTQSLKSPLPPVISVCTRAQCEHISGISLDISQSSGVLATQTPNLNLIIQLLSCQSCLFKRFNGIVRHTLLDRKPLLETLKVPPPISVCFPAATAGRSSS
ncbi:hypothetical protein F2P81_015136 [Scophthalmus maximus]|uniref:Uncharacterized protein n=1 Tax=Scophthalmus maximus TaxID=52904 RepID=A0A6A4SCH6_SCOMX|nr:hypothetical protein F2P81_015136 [Scophthalmus maximus]